MRETEKDPDFIRRCVEARKPKPFAGPLTPSAAARHIDPTVRVTSQNSLPILTTIALQYSSSFSLCISPRAEEWRGADKSRIERKVRGCSHRRR
ncbi:hypothetical protein MRX96_055381 [Rhipicephalus microplus]